jgi:hypothetical protein
MMRPATPGAFQQTWVLFAGEDVDAVGLCFNVGVGGALDHFIYMEACGGEVAEHFIALEEDEIKLDGMLPQFVKVANLRSAMKGKQ